MKLFNSLREKMYGKSLSPQEKQVKAEMMYRSQERAFAKYDVDLDKSIAHLKRIVYDEHIKGHDGNAKTAARFVTRMEVVKEKVSSVRTHFEMLNVLSKVSNIMVQFMDSVSASGINISEQINLGDFANGQMNLDMSLDKLSQISDTVDSALDSIDKGLDPITGKDTSFTSEDEEAMNKIISEFESTVAPQPVAPTPSIPAAPVYTPSTAPVQPVPEPDDGMRELKKRLSEEQ